MSAPETRPPLRPETPPTRYVKPFGLSLSGMALTAGLTLLLWDGLTATHGNDWGRAYALAFGGMICAALGLAWAILLFFNVFRHGWKRIALFHRLCALSPLLPLGVIAVASLFAQNEKERREKEYPGMYEAHVNLSGKVLRLRHPASDLSCEDSRGYLDNANDQVSSRCTRWYQEDSAKDAPSADAPGPSHTTYRDLYANGRLKPEANELFREEYDSESDTANNPPSSRSKRYPLQVTGQWPAFEGLPPYRSGGYSQVTAGSVRSVYYHYPEHSEVAPVIQMSGSELLALEGQLGNLQQIKVHNYTTTPLIRIEIDGQTLDIHGGTRGVEPATAEDCRAYAGYVNLPATGRWRIRWQTVEPPHAWQQAEIELPAFSRPEIPAKARSEQSIVLYLLPGAEDAAPTWVAQRIIMGDIRKIPADWPYTPINRPAHAAQMIQISPVKAIPESYPCGKNEDIRLDDLQIVAP